MPVPTFSNHLVSKDARWPFDRCRAMTQRQMAVQLNASGIGAVQGGRWHWLSCSGCWLVSNECCRYKQRYAATDLPIYLQLLLRIGASSAFYTTMVAVPPAPTLRWFFFLSLHQLYKRSNNSRLSNKQTCQPLDDVSFGRLNFCF